MESSFLPEGGGAYELRCSQPAEGERDVFYFSFGSGLVWGFLLAWTSFCSVAWRLHELTLWFDTTHLPQMFTEGRIKGVWLWQVSRVLSGPSGSKGKNVEEKYCDANLCESITDVFNQPVILPWAKSLSLTLSSPLTPPPAHPPPHPPPPCMSGLGVQHEAGQLSRGSECGGQGSSRPLPSKETRLLGPEKSRSAELQLSRFIYLVH